MRFPALRGEANVLKGRDPAAATSIMNIACLSKAKQPLIYGPIRKSHACSYLPFLSLRRHCRLSSLILHVGLRQSTMKHDSPQWLHLRVFLLPQLGDLGAFKP